METISIGYLCYRTQDWLSEVDISDGAKLTYMHILAASRGRNHAWPSMKYLAAKAKVSIRTIQRRVKEQEMAGLIANFRKETKEMSRKAFAILPHPGLLAWIENLGKWLKRIRVTVTTIDADPVVADTPRVSPKTSEVSQPPNYSEESVVTSTPITPQPGRTAEASADDVPNNTQPPPAAITCDLTQAVTPLPPPHAWLAAVEILRKNQRPGDFELWIEPIQARMTSSGLCLECLDVYIATYVTDHFHTAIAAALQQQGVGVREFYLCAAQQPNMRRTTPKKELQKEKTKLKLAELPLEAQFQCLLQAYPHKSSGSWWAWRSFKRLARKGHLPAIHELLDLVNFSKISAEWIRDNGRYIPALNKWLNSRPWWTLPSQHVPSRTE